MAGTGRLSHGAGGVSQRQAAVTAGVAYLLIGGVAFFANFFVLLRFVEPGAASATVRNIAGSEVLFRSGIAGFVIVAVLDLVIAWALHMLLRQVNSDVSLLTAWFRLAYAAILGIAVLNLIVALQLAGDAGYVAALDTGTREAQVMLFTDAFRYAWLVGLVCFGIHLLLLAYLLLTSGAIPRILGVLLVLAGLGYLADSFAHILLPDYDDYAQAFLVAVAVPSAVGEMWFAVWLLLRGGRQPAVAR